MGKRAGIRKIDTVTWEDGTTIDIKLDTSDGRFVATLEDSFGSHIFSIENKDMIEIKKQLKKLEVEHVSFKWEPFIAIEAESQRRGRYSGSSYYNCDHEMNFSYSRFYRAAKKDGDFLYCEFIPKKVETKKKSDDFYENNWQLRDEQRFLDDEVAQDVTEGSMGKRVNHVRASTDAAVIPYSPSDWMALRVLTKSIRELGKKIETMVSGGKVKETLSRIADRGFQSLLEAPKGK